MASLFTFVYFILMLAICIARQSAIGRNGGRQLTLFGNNETMNTYTETGQNETTKIKVRVKQLQNPDFGPLISPYKLEVNYTGPLKLFCDPTGDPKPEIVWLKNDQILQQSDRLKSYDNGTLKINYLTKEDPGEYTCSLENKLGKNKKNFKVSVLSVEDTVLSKTSIILVISLIILIILLILTRCVVKLKNRKTNVPRELYNKPELDTNIPVNEQIENLPYDPRYEIPFERLTIGHLLRNGYFQYSKVFQGKILQTAEIERNPMVVAVKMPKNSRDVEHLISLLSELKIMIYIGDHINILRLIGAITEHMVSGQLYVITEYCNLGPLDDYLKKYRTKFINEIVRCDGSNDKSMENLVQVNGYMTPNMSNIVNDNMKTRYKGQEDDAWSRNIADNLLTKSFLCTTDLLSFAYQVANGMEFLASKNLIHRDLAARNILVNSDLLIKISEFSLAYHGDKYIINNTDILLPIKWTALESLVDRQVTVHSDVWSYGVLLWEIFSLAETPYTDHRYGPEFIQWLKNGNRLAPTSYVPVEIYHLMRKCWDEEPTARPSFAKCRDLLDQEMSLCCPIVRDHLLETLRASGEDNTNMPVRHGSQFRPVSAINTHDQSENDDLAENPFYFSDTPLLNANEAFEMNHVGGQ